MKIGLLGTGNLAVALGAAWAGAGHEVGITGRSAEHAIAAAEAIGDGAVATSPRDLAGAVDVFVVAVPWGGIDEALSLVGGPDGALSGTTVVDCTNAVDDATKRLLPASGSAAEAVARLAPGASVVKALHLFAGVSWPFSGSEADAPVVAICGDSPEALQCVATLVADLGGRTAVLGGLEAARQAEEAAGFVMRVVAAGANPRLAVPDVRPRVQGAGHEGDHGAVSCPA